MSAKDVDVGEDCLSSFVVSAGGLHLETEETNPVLPISLDAWYLYPVGALGMTKVLEVTYRRPFRIVGNGGKLGPMWSRVRSFPCARRSVADFDASRSHMGRGETNGTHRSTLKCKRLSTTKLGYEC